MLCLVLEILEEKYGKRNIYIYNKLFLYVNSNPYIILYNLKRDIVLVEFNYILIFKIFYNKIEKIIFHIIFFLFFLILLES